MEQLKRMKECLVSIAEEQVYGNIEKVNAKELGEVMDMIKDLSEAMYYCTITESMEEQSSKEARDHRYMMYPIDRRESSMYAQGGARMGGGRAPMSNRNTDGMIRRYDDGQVSYSMYHDPMEHPYYDEMYGPMMRDPREGRSGERRKMYMEGKGYKDKSKQMQELEAYMQELATDMTEMIQDASPEERQFLQTKIATLAQKVK